METEHPETVVEKVTSYVKDMLGIPHEHEPSVEAEPERRVFAPDQRGVVAPEPTGVFAPDPTGVFAPEPTGVFAPDPTGVFAPEPTIEDAMRIEPRSYTTETAAELNAESARREDGVGM